VNQFTSQELSTLTWTFEPEKLPINVIWHYTVPEGMHRTERVHALQSGEELTGCWQEQIWSKLATSPHVKITLDAGSFGCIELSIAALESQQATIAQLLDHRLVSQLLWLSGIIEAKQSWGSIPFPALLRKTIIQLCTRADVGPLLSIALKRLARARTTTAWMLFRLQAILAVIEEGSGEV